MTPKSRNNRAREHTGIETKNSCADKGQQQLPDKIRIAVIKMKPNCSSGHRNYFFKFYNSTSIQKIPWSLPRATTSKHSNGFLIATLLLSEGKDKAWESSNYIVPFH